MQSNPLVTVITPTYNHEKYIIDCIKSVQAQTFTGWEMIIVNDGSTDRTADVISDYIKDDFRIQLINQKNIGIFRLKETYQHGLNIAKGKYIAIIDGDDVWEPDKLECQVSALENNQNAILSWGKAYSSSDDLSVNITLSPNLHLSDEKKAYFNNKPEGSILNLLLIENCIPAMTITVRKSILDNIGGFLQGYDLPLVDIPTLIELAKIGEFNYIDRPLGRWRTYSHQTTKTFPVEITKARLKLCLDQYAGLSPEIKNKLLISKNDIEKHFNKYILIAYARSGRYKLIRKIFAEARKDYLKAIFYKGFNNPVWRLRAIIGYVFSLFRMDVEGVSKLLGKDSYNK
jgi:glycosyltransferase involved in cell wall biosynthesis